MSPSAPLPRPLMGGERLEISTAEVGAPTRLTVWRHIRALRYGPPGRAGSGQRRRIFGSALEQAEQLFTAADGVDYASRPILLFYGLSQAGSAIAAASTLAGGSDYRLRGHGITTQNLDYRELHRITVIDDGVGSFTQLAPLLRSGSLQSGTPVGQLWAVIPDLREFPLHTDSTEYSPVLRYSNLAMQVLAIHGRLSWSPSRLATAANQEIIEFLAAYPSLAGHDVSSRTGLLSEPGADRKTVDLYRSWSVPENRDELEPLTSRERRMGEANIVEGRLTQPYRGDSERYVFPAIGGAAWPLHPLLAWWALLYTLSMLARYEPASWSTHLERDSSPNAIAIEAALDRALHTCPELIIHTIRAVVE
jgi:YaaC-like protein